MCVCVPESQWNAITDYCPISVFSTRVAFYQYIIALLSQYILDEWNNASHNLRLIQRDIELLHSNLLSHIFRQLLFTFEFFYIFHVQNWIEMFTWFAGVFFFCKMAEMNGIYVSKCLWHDWKTSKKNDKNDFRHLCNCKLNIRVPDSGAYLRFFFLLPWEYSIYFNFMFASFIFKEEIFK